MRWFRWRLWFGTAPSGQQPLPVPVITISSPVYPPPQMFTNVATLIDGQYREAGVILVRNGLVLTEGLDYTRSGGRVTMTVAPVAGDVLTARVFAIGSQLGGSSQFRYLAPWSFRLTGAFDGTATAYQISYGPAITGSCDGRNPAFNISVTRSRMQVFRNGVIQTAGVDYSAGSTRVVFFAASVPQSGDFLTFLGY